MGQQNFFIRNARKLIFVMVLLPSALFVFVSILLLLYTFMPIMMDVPVIMVSENLTLLAHGINDSPDTWSARQADTLNNRDPAQKAYAIDWSSYAESVFRCLVNGLRLGRKIGRQLLDRKKLQSLHLVGHSCGAFVVYGICRGLKDYGSEVMVHTTYLDPVSNYGGIYTSYGLKHFGSCGNFSEAYIDTGDRVPGSNQMLPYAHTFDVTSSRLKDGFSGNPHLWPVEFYSRLVETGQQPSIRKDKHIAEKYRPGVMETL